MERGGDAAAKTVALVAWSNTELTPTGERAIARLVHLGEHNVDRPAARGERRGAAVVLGLTRRENGLP
jgi:hypothetical protein